MSKMNKHVPQFGLGRPDQVKSINLIDKNFLNRGTSNLGKTSDRSVSSLNQAAANHNNTYKTRKSMPFRFDEQPSMRSMNYNSDRMLTDVEEINKQEFGV